MQAPLMVQHQANHSVLVFPAALCRIPERRAPLAQIADEVIGSRIVGVRRLERALPTGTMLTAIGELSTAMDDPAAFKVLCLCRAASEPAPCLECLVARWLRCRLATVGVVLCCVVLRHC
jgi:hypothetical protein